MSFWESLQSLGGVIARAAPTIAGDLMPGGGLAVDVVESIAQAFGGSAEDPADLANKIAKDPQAALKLAQIRADKAAAIEAEKTKRQASSDRVIRDQIKKGGDTYERHTRPGLARWSMAGGIAYILVSLIGHGLADAVPLPQVTVFMAIISPAYFYMTGRTIDGFSPAGRTGVGRPGNVADPR